MEEIDLFFSAAILLIVQCLLAGSINLANPKISNKLLGVLIILFLDYYRYILFGFCINQELLNALLLSKFSLAQFYGPIIFLFLSSIVRPVSFKQFSNHLIVPGLFTIYLLVVVGLKYSYGIAIYNPFVPFTSILAAIYLWLSFRLINSNAWEGIKISKRYRRFYYIVGGFLIFSQAIHILVSISLHYEFYQPLQPVFGFFEKTSFILVNNYLFFFGFTELNSLKKLFVPFNSESEIVKLNGQKIVILEKIESHVQSGIYKDPTLNLEEFAHQIGITKTQLSEIFKTHYKMAFTEKLNEWRLEEFKKNLLDQKFSHLDLIGLAHQAGFNSKATFNRFFKVKEGITPSEYRKQLVNDNELKSLQTNLN